MNRLNKKEEDYNKNYYKEQPDYDDAKKSRFDKLFRRNKQ